VKRSNQDIECLPGAGAVRRVVGSSSAAAAQCEANKPAAAVDGRVIVQGYRSASLHTVNGRAVPPTGSRVDEGRTAAAAHWEHFDDTSILIVDDCTLHRETLAAIFEPNGCEAPSVAWDLESLVAALTCNRPDLVLINHETRDSPILLQAIFELCPDIRVIALGMSEDDETAIVSCAEAGIAGYHLRGESLDDLLALIHRVANGESVCSPRVAAILLHRLSALAAERHPTAMELVLSVREVQILTMLELGLSNRDIADRLCIAVHTVKNHVHSVLTKLGVSNRAEAAASFRTLRLAEVGPGN
jgi:DNA-binding NarL/FixJ family response regulator